ncbi:hypothetical protein AAMO2058_000988100 [Amorphochlora amoebiformis]
MVYGPFSRDLKINSRIFRAKTPRALLVRKQRVRAKSDHDPSWWVGYDDPSLRRIASERANNYLSRGMWEDVNFSPKSFWIPMKESEGNREARKWNSNFKIKFKSFGEGKHPKVAEAMIETYAPCKVGDKFGPTWSTHYFEITFTLPKISENQGLIPTLLFDCNAEAMLYSDQGIPLQAFTGGDRAERRAEFFLDQFQEGTDRKVTFYIEMAANGMFGAGAGNDIMPTDLKRFYTLSLAEAYDLYNDLTVLRDMSKHLPQGSPRGLQALRSLNGAINTLRPGDRSTYAKTKEISEDFLGVPNRDYNHTIYATGHCHIDTAWLWPYRETRRKCARSWVTQMRLAKRYPGYKFTLSQPQQLQWVKDDYPTVFEDILDSVQNGTFIPLGATWVEMDANIPDGESFCRQFLLGQKFFKDHFGRRSNIFWLPDTFGYSAQLPQICRLSGVEYFLTQKLSWNLINKFPYHSFKWIGIDGSELLTHFPPADTYVDKGDVGSVGYHMENYKQKAVSQESMMLFGHGDGGGGPEMAHLERIKRIQNTSGLPWVKIASPGDFFEALEKRKNSLPRWRGELYLELHRGTYTTHAKIKKANRDAEKLLRNLEIFATAASGSQSSPGFEYPKGELDDMWKDILLNQFHDVLPGTCIEEAANDSMNIYSKVLSEASRLENAALTHLIQDFGGKEGAGIVVNTLGWPRREVIDIPNSESSSVPHLVSTPPLGLSSLPEGGVPEGGVPEGGVPAGGVPVKVGEGGGEVWIENEEIVLRICKKSGRIVNFRDKRFNMRDVTTDSTVSPGEAGANRFVIYEDIPLFWDAWDLELYYNQKPQDIGDAYSVKILESHPLRATVCLEWKFGNSRIVQNIVVRYGSARVDFQTRVDWHENRKCLKVLFPLEIESDYGTFEIQYGHVRRPSHTNTLWDLAKFETVAHRWGDISEHGFGVAILSDSKYGYSIHEGHTLGLTILRSSKAPDAKADMGSHDFTYALFPHPNGPEEGGVIQEGYALNHPMKVIEGSGLSETLSLASVDVPNVIVTSIKKAEDSSGDIIVRLYEAYGARGPATLFLSPLLLTKPNLTENKDPPKPFASRCNILEDVLEELKVNVGHHEDLEVGFHMRPFQVQTLRVGIKS